MSNPFAMMKGMEVAFVDHANGLLEKANANLEPELLSTAAACELLDPPGPDQT